MLRALASQVNQHQEFPLNLGRCEKLLIRTQVGASRRVGMGLGGVLPREKTGAASGVLHAGARHRFDP